MQKKQDIARIPVEQIYPDPDQPRKRLPRDFARAVREGMDARTLLQELRTRAETQAGLGTFLIGLDDLANSINQVGQLAPIRVYPEGKHYIIELGERRWLAHLILYIERGESEFSHIDAIIMPKSKEASVDAQTLQRRMAENIHRAEFSPIEMARGLLERIDQLRRENSEMNRSKAEEFIGTENGITARRVRQYLSLLKLCDQAQQLAQENGLTERALRGVLKFQKPEAQVEAVQKLIAGEREKSEIAPATATNEKRAETFVENLLELTKHKQESKRCEQLLRVRLKKNPRARLFLSHVFRLPKQIDFKRAASKYVSNTHIPRQLKRVRQRTNKRLNSLPPYERDVRRNRRRRR